MCRSQPEAPDKPLVYGSRDRHLAEALLDYDLSISALDRDVLRSLAAQVAELAARPIEDEKRDLWYRHNALEPTRPLIFCDLENGWKEIVAPAVLLVPGRAGATVGAISAQGGPLGHRAAGRRRDQTPFRGAPRPRRPGLGPGGNPHRRRRGRKYGLYLGSGHQERGGHRKAAGAMHHGGSGGYGSPATVAWRSS